MSKEINLNGKTYILKEEEEASINDDNGNQECYNSTICHNSTNCDNSTGCDNSTWCHNSTWCDNSTYCHNSTRCDNSTGCDNSTYCDNSTRCDNCAYLLFCSNQVLTKFMIFNKQLETKDKFNKIRKLILSKLGYYKHPKQLTQEDKDWLKANIKQYDETVLNEIIEDSISPDKPKKE